MRYPSIQVVLSLVLVSWWLCPAMSHAQTLTANQLKEKEFRIERSMSKQAKACIMCHKEEHPGLFTDWANSRHASANITCLDCH